MSIESGVLTRAFQWVRGPFGGRHYEGLNYWVCARNEKFDVFSFGSYIRLFEKLEAFYAVYRSSHSICLLMHVIVLDLDGNSGLPLGTGYNQSSI